jgi:hypothetical protein
LSRRAAAASASFDRNLLVQSPRYLAEKGAEVARASNRPDVGARPDEAIELVDDDPAAGVAEPEMDPNPRRHFDSIGGLARWLSGDRCDEEFDTLRSLLRREDHHDRSFLRPFVASSLCLPSPEIDVGENVSRLGNRP